MNHSGNELQILKKLSNSPYDPEPPKKRLSVSLIMQLAQRFKHSNFYTPHLYGGSNLAKVEYEYQNATYLFEVLGNIDLTLFDNKEILDVGCGWGGKMIYYAENSNLKSIAGFDLPGVYLPEFSYEYAATKKVANCIFQTGYAEVIPFQDEQFDLVLMDDVMEHVREPQKVLAECYRVLRPKGRIIVKFPSIKMIWAHHLDRAISFPGLHYLLSLKTWAEGLNYLLVQGKYQFEPFEKVVVSKYTHWKVTNSLNGLDFQSFSNLVNRTPFTKISLECRPFGRKNQPDSVIRKIYRVLYRAELFKEFLSSFVLFIGEK